jgi:hypothetical protein
MDVIQRAGYRVRQFWRASKAGPLPDESWHDIGSVLAPAELELYKRQSHGDQQHAYRVMCTLRAAGHDEPDLLAAALLHDAGKCFARNFWWDRPLVVLFQAFAPSWSAELANGDPTGWKRPFVVRERHAEWGADAARKAGSSAATVVLIRRHQDPPCQNDNDRDACLLARLQWADDSN